MIPVHFVRVADLPRNRNGKLDRSALPEPDLAARDRVVIAPRDDIEAGVLAIWRDLLSIEDISVEDHFFELGGHSLLATQVTSRIRRDLGVSISVAERLRTSDAGAARDGDPRAGLRKADTGSRRSTRGAAHRAGAPEA